MTVTYALSTFPGNREQNEDYMLAGSDGNRYCFAVADGLGGHGQGEVASRVVCETALRCFTDGKETDPGVMFMQAQERLLEEQRRAKAEDAMKTTLNLLIADAGGIRWGHVGDTRTYYFRKKKMVSRTRDHSVPQMMVSMGEIKEKEIRHHVDRSRLLRVMGIEWTKPQYVLEENVRIQGKQAFLMCTDGFWEYIEDREMEKCLKKAGSVQDWLDSMNEIVRQNGQGQDMDNYTALAVWFD